jgi:hypothetical protein
MDKNIIIQEIENLLQHETIDAGQASLFESKYSPVKEYLFNLSLNVKPESAASELIKHLFRDILKDGFKAEIFVEGSFVDFVIQESSTGNPVWIELKPLYRFDKSQNTIKKNLLSYEAHQNQIQKYLRHKKIEYVILTNIDTAFLFNRNAVIDYKPFAEVKLTDLLKDYLINENLWDNVRKLEDNKEIINLDKSFFSDLKKWYEEFAPVKFDGKSKFSKEELVVLFLNKFIFIKTLEDFGLIPYRFILDEYENYVRKWSTKGYDLVFKQFFQEIEEFFEVYYDTELFTSNIWNYVDDDDTNVRLFQAAFERILGLDQWHITFGMGLVHYNYRRIDEDIFGKAYETWIAENRKDEGIYYTHNLITKYMADKIVSSLFDDKIDELIEELNRPVHDAQKIDSIVKEIEGIKIIDPTSGSGSFLIKVLKVIYEKYQKIAKAVSWVKDYHNGDIFNVPENIIFISNFRDKMNFTDGKELRLISRIILNHIFAADKDERAIDTAKTNIWKEAVKLNPAIYNYRKLDKKKVHILPNLEMNFITGDSLTGINFEEQLKIITENYKEELLEMIRVRKNYIDNPYKPEIISAYLEAKQKIKKKILEKNEFDDSVCFPVDFYYCFFDDDGNPLADNERGFSGIISNPPWEAVKPVKKEFAKQGKNELDVLRFNEWFKNELKKNKNFKDEWEIYKKHYEEYSDYLYEKYSYQGSGDPNLYKFFMERDFELLKKGGNYVLLVPSGFQTDEGSSELRKLLIENNRLIEISSFENRGFYEEDKNRKTIIFPDVDNRFKFSIVLAKKLNAKQDDYNFNSKFYLHNPEDLNNEKFIEYDIEKIRKFSPVNHSIMEFKSNRDYETCLKIADNHPALSDLDYVLRSEFHMTNDSDLFKNELQHKKEGKNDLVLFEGKMIHQFTSSYSHPRYYLPEYDARERLLNKVFYRIRREYGLSKDDFDLIEIPLDLKMDYQTYRLVYRAIGRSTDQRTLISSIVPKNVFIGHSMNYNVNVNYELTENKISWEINKYENVILLCSLLNSLTLNYYIRNKISANLTMNFIYELPIAEATEELEKEIIQKGFSLLYKKSNSPDFDDLRKELKVEVTEEQDLAKLRAELEILIARGLYGLDKSDWEYITSTFVYGGDSDTKAELDEIIRYSLEIW